MIKIYFIQIYIYDLKNIPIILESTAIDIYKVKYLRRYVAYFAAKSRHCAVDALYGYVKNAVKTVIKKVSSSITLLVPESIYAEKNAVEKIF